MVQVVLLFGLETKVVTPRMGMSPRGSQDQVATRLTGRLLRRKPDEKWMYTSAVTAREEVGLLKMEEYIWRCQNTVA